MSLLSISKNDKKARLLIFSFSLFVFLAITLLGRYKLNVDLPFDEHLFAKVNAGINSMVALLLVGGLFTARTGRYTTHKYIMLTAMCLSILFLVSYICHHLFTGEAKFGDIDGDGLLSATEVAAAGSLRYVYYIILSTHIVLAGVVLPFILFTAYRALIGENSKHRKLAKITWPMWFYVAVTGPAIYFMIRVYY